MNLWAEHFTTQANTFYIVKPRSCNSYFVWIIPQIWLPMLSYHDWHTSFLILMVCFALTGGAPNSFVVSVSSYRTRCKCSVWEEVLYMLLWWPFVLYLSCLWAFVIYVWTHLLVLCTTRSYFSSKAEQKDALNTIVLSAYLHLQSEGFLSTWTNSFVGPWDPSQGEHNPGNDHMYWLLNVYLFFFHLKFGLGWCIPHDFAMLTDEKIKLWLFLPGCHSSVSENAQPAVNKLRGWFWLIFLFIMMS